MRRLSAALIAVIATCLMYGCSTPPTPRSIGDLYHEALADSEAQRRDLALAPWAAGGRAQASFNTDPTHQGISRSAGRSNVQQAGGSVTSGDNAVTFAHSVSAATSGTGHPPLSSQTQYFSDSHSTAKVSDVFAETDIREAIQSLATQAKVSVIIDEQVRGATSALIEDEPFEAALRKVLLSLGYVYRKKDGHYLIGLADPESSLFPMLAERFDYRPQHVSPEELQALLPERLKKFVRIVAKRNRIIIEAPKEIASQVLTELERSDQQVPQVILEAMVCVFSPESKFQSGFDLEQAVIDQGQKVVSLGLSGLNFAGAGSLARLNHVFADFSVTSAFLRLLAQEGYLQIRATPRVMAKDGEKANISIARETYFSIQPLNAENAVLFRQDIEKVESGIVLDIVPQIRGDHVTVTIERAEVSEDIRAADFGNQSQNRFPLINRRTVSTTVDVPDGQTIVIGGLVQRQVVDRLSKVPVLGDIPWVGFFFRQIDKQEKEVEVAIFLSPRIVRDPAPPAPPQAMPSADAAWESVPEEEVEPSDQWVEPLSSRAGKPVPGMTFDAPPLAQPPEPAPLDPSIAIPVHSQKRSKLQ